MGVGALAIQVQQSWFHVMRFMFWGFGYLSRNRFNILINLISVIKGVSSFCDSILGGMSKLGFKVHHGGDTRFKGLGMMLLVVSVGGGCSSNHPHHLHHHLGEILQILKYFFFQGSSPHHYCGTWGKCVEPPKGLDNIWGWLAPLS